MANISNLDAVFASRINAAIAAAEAATGATANITSGFRTYDEQAGLYAAYQHGGAIAARPGHSRHELGQAIDLGPGPVRDWIQAHAADYGLEPAIPKRGWGADRPHVQLARGIAKTPYDAGAGLVVPPGDVGQTAQGAQMPLGMGRGHISSGPAVAALQQQLAASGFNPGKVDGSFGSRTQAALKAYQSANNLAPDGVAGPLTLARIGGGAATEDIASAGRLANPETQGVPLGGTPTPEVSPTDYALHGAPDSTGAPPAASPSFGPIVTGPPPGASVAPSGSRPTMWGLSGQSWPGAAKNQQIDAAMAKIAADKGYDYKSINVSGDDKAAQLAAIKAQIKPGDGVVGFSAGAYVGQTLLQSLPAGTVKDAVLIGGPDNVQASGTDVTAVPSLPGVKHVDLAEAVAPHQMTLPTPRPSDVAAADGQTPPSAPEAPAISPSAPAADNRPEPAIQVRPGPYGADKVITAAATGNPALLKSAYDTMVKTATDQAGFGDAIGSMFGGGPKARIAAYFTNIAQTDPQTALQVKGAFAANPALAQALPADVAGQLQKGFAKVQPMGLSGSSAMGGPDVAATDTGNGTMQWNGEPPAVASASPGFPTAWGVQPDGADGPGAVATAPSLPLGSMGAPPPTGIGMPAGSVPPSGEAAMWNEWSKSPAVGVPAATAYDQAYQKRMQELTGPGFPSAWGEQPQEPGQAPTGQPIDEQTLSLLQRNVPGANSAMDNWQRDQLANALTAKTAGAGLTPYSRGVTGTPQPFFGDQLSDAISGAGDAIGSDASAIWNGLGSGVDAARQGLANWGIIDPANATEAPPGPQSYYTPPTGRISGMAQYAGPGVPADDRIEAPDWKTPLDWMPGASFFKQAMTTAMPNRESVPYALRGVTLGNPSDYVMPQSDTITGGGSDNTLMGSGGPLPNPVPARGPFSTPQLFGMPIQPPEQFHDRDLLDQHNAPVRLTMPQQDAALSGGGSDNYLQGGGGFGGAVDAFFNNSPALASAAAAPTAQDSAYNYNPTPEFGGKPITDASQSDTITGGDQSKDATPKWGDPISYGATAKPAVYVAPTAAPDNSIAGITFADSAPAATSFDAAPAVSLAPPKGAAAYNPVAEMTGAISGLKVPKSVVSGGNQASARSSGGGPSFGIPNISDVISAASKAGYSTTPTRMLGALARGGFSMPNFSTGSGGSIFASKSGTGGYTDVHGNWQPTGSYVDSNGVTRSFDMG